MRFDEHFFKQIIPQVTIFGKFPQEFNITTDSRTIGHNDIFLALPGEHYDGHAFIADAFANGASGVIVAAEKKDIYEGVLAQVKNKLIIIVPDPLNALIGLATAWRKKFSYPVIGVTGSIGKTSTKEQLAVLMKVAGKKPLVSRGNQNTQIGAAINILRMSSDHDIAIFEMGISGRNEMGLIACLVQPTIAVITKIGHSHMQGLGSLQDIAHQKRDIFSCFSSDNIGIINGDQPFLSNVSFAHPVIRFGTKTTNQIQARRIKFIDNATHFVLKIYKHNYELVVPKAHEGVVYAALVTAAVGHVLAISHDAIIKAIQTPVVVAGRFEKKEFKDRRGIIINDCYNASPESMKAALLALEHITYRSEKIAILGDMLELGPNSPFWHRQIGRFLRKVPTLKKVILVGNMVQWIESTLPLGVEAIRVANWQEARDRLAQVMGDREALVLVKGSLGMGLLNLVKHYAK